MQTHANTFTSFISSIYDNTEDNGEKEETPQSSFSSQKVNAACRHHYLKKWLIPEPSQGNHEQTQEKDAETTPRGFH